MNRAFTDTQAFASALAVALCLLSTSLNAAEVATTQADQTRLALTIYNHDLALIKDQRQVSLEQGTVDLAFREVSAHIRPETALLTSHSAPGSLTLIEQNFDFDLLTPQSLLQAYVGKTVTVIRQHPTTGAESRQTAQVLSTQEGTVLKIGDHIETGLPGRISFPSVPVNFRDRPTLIMKLNNQSPDAQDIELSYLSGGLSWQANYVAQLSADETQLNLSGWVTLNNQSGSSYPNAHIQLVAGDVNVVQAPMAHLPEMRFKIAAMAAPPQIDQENLFDYHLYSLGHPTTLANNQTKQVALLSAAEVPVSKHYRLRGQAWLYQSRQAEPQTKLKVKTELRFNNDQASHLGKPLPKGTIRLYKNDRSGGAQFIGEDALDHTPENTLITLSPGNAFDLSAKRQQRIFKQQRFAQPPQLQTDSGISISVSNAKDEAVIVQIEEPIPGEWHIIEGRQPDERIGNLAVWFLQVPAKGSASLEFRVETKM